MNEEQAEKVAEALGGNSWQSGGNIWLVLIHRQDGKLVVISDDLVAEYDNEEAFQDGKALQSIVLY